MTGVQLVAFHLCDGQKEVLNWIMAQSMAKLVQKKNMKTSIL